MHVPFMILLICLLCGYLHTGIDALAGAPNQVVQCKQTVRYQSDVATPENFMKTNNLRREAGTVNFAKGDNIIITGKIVGTDCVPLESARVRIWHADSEGRYVHLDDDADPNFLGSGTTYTNNLGEFFFLTIMPGESDDGSAPIVYVTVDYGQVRTLKTAMLFPQYNIKLPFEVREQLQANYKGERNMSDVYLFNLVLPVESPHRMF